MKFLACLLLGAVALAAVSAQTQNYLMAAYNEAVEMKIMYNEETAYFQDYLTWEADDMGYYFTDLLAQASAIATTQAQGDGIAYCARNSHYLNWSNIMYMSLYMLETGRVATRFHLSVLAQLRAMNIKEYDLELFYYYHTYVMQEAYDDLWYYYSYNMLNAWLNVYLDFYYNYDELFECLTAALY